MFPNDTRRLRDDATSVVADMGRPGSRSLLPTPALVCDVDLLEANLARMASRARSAGVALRPHTKTHKSGFVARRQLAHGAVGLACATTSEADALVRRLREDGHADRLSVLVTSPTAGPEAARRQADLATRCDLLTVVDHPDGVDQLGGAAAAVGAVVSVVCDVDVGLGRTGVTGPDGARAVVDRIARHPGLRLAGVQGYAGQNQHLSGDDRRMAATREATGRLVAVVVALESDGHLVDLRTGGGTGTIAADLDLGVLNEVQPGSYAFMDRQYRDALGDDTDGDFAQSLTVATTVVSDNQEGFVTVDAGLKALATDAGTPTVVGRADAAYHFFGDEHGLVTRSPGSALTRADRLDLVPPHCDPTVDRYDVLWLVRGDTVVGVADIDARGCSQ